MHGNCRKCGKRSLAVDEVVNAGHLTSRHRPPHDVGAFYPKRIRGPGHTETDPSGVRLQRYGDQPNASDGQYVVLYGDSENTTGSPQDRMHSPLSKAFGDTVVMIH